MKNALLTVKNFVETHKAQILTGALLASATVIVAQRQALVDANEALSAASAALSETITEL